MVNFKETVTKLHKEFPEFDLDTLIRIIDNIVETASYTNIRQPLDKSWLETNITCANGFK